MIQPFSRISPREEYEARACTASLCDPTIDINFIYTHYFVAAIIH